MLLRDFFTPHRPSPQLPTASFRKREGADLIVIMLKPLQGHGVLGDSLYGVDSDGAFLNLSYAKMNRVLEKSKEGVGFLEIDFQNKRARFLSSDAYLKRAKTSPETPAP